MDFMLRCCSQQAEETENQRQARLLKDSAAEVLRLEHGKNYGPGRVKRGKPVIVQKLRPHVLSLFDIRI